MAGLNVGAVHQDQALTNVSVMYRNGDFVAESVMPTLPQDNQSAKYFVYGTENLRADDDTRRPGATSNKMEWSLSLNPNYCDGHAQHALIPDEWRENADQALDLDTDLTVALTDKMLLSREVNVAASVAASAASVDQAGQKWDVNTNDPVNFIDQYKETIGLAIGRTPNCLLLSRPTFRGLRNNLLVKNRISGAADLPASKITAQMLADTLEVDEVIVASAVKLTSVEGQTDASSYVWGKNALLFYRPPSPGLRTVALGYLFTWMKGRLGGMVFKGRQPDLEHSDYVEVMRYYDARIVSAAAGLWLPNCVS